MSMSAPAAPIMVLVRPQLGENIGKVARAMANFGLTELRMVAPRDGWPNPAAGPAAAGADWVLEGAKIYTSTAEAVADCAHVYATTVRKRGVTKPVLTPAEAAEDIAAEGGRSAVLFGAERSGLDSDDVALARSIITVPVNPEFSSLNLAQAVILMAYEWSKIEWAKTQPQAGQAQQENNSAAPGDSPGSSEADASASGGVRALEQPTQSADILPPAPQAELDGLIAHFEEVLEPRGYFLPAERAASTRRTLRSLLTKPGWNHLEVRTLRGVLATLGRDKR